MTEQHLPIVVGVDGHETGRRALEWALREARSRNCPVEVVHAWTFDPMADYFTETSSQQVHQESLAMLRRGNFPATKKMTAVSPISPANLEGGPNCVPPELGARAPHPLVRRPPGGLVPGGVAWAVRR